MDTPRINISNSVWILQQKALLDSFFFNLDKVCIESVTIMFFGHEPCRILASQPGIEPSSPALEGKVFTTGLSKIFALSNRIQIASELGNWLKSCVK